MGTQLRDFAKAGTSIWLDNIRRNMFASGELKGLIDGGLRGMTSNPTIFEKAFGAGSDYDAQLAEVAAKETDLQEIFETLAIDDIRHACDLFRPLFEETHGADGFVSLEVSPRLGHDTEGTIKAAKRLWEKVERPNVMIKIPGTPRATNRSTKSHRLQAGSFRASTLPSTKCSKRKSPRVNRSKVSSARSASPT